jgi:hypothetical protein
MNPVHTFPSILKLHFNIMPPLLLGLKLSLSFRSLSQHLICISTLMRVACPVNLIPSLTILIAFWPITMAARSKAWTVFVRSNTTIVGSNPTQGMDICVRLCCVCVVLCGGSGLATDWSPVRGVLLTVYGSKKLKKRPRCSKRTVEPYIDR